MTMTGIDRDFMLNTRDFLKRYPISAPDGSAARASGDKTKSFTKLKFTNLQDRIAYVRMTPADRGKVGAMTFQAKYSSEVSGSRSDYVPIWWLPWSPGHMTKLKIEPTTTRLRDGLGRTVTNPGVFVTAALSGCSVFVTGDPMSPSVYHGGLEDNLAHFFSNRADQLATFAPGGTSREFWETILDGVDGHTGRRDIQAPLHDGNQQSMQIKARPPIHVGKSQRATTGKVSKDDYVNFAGSGTTPLTTAYQQLIESQNPRGINIETVAPWGAVFGVRASDGRWKFYLQENATVSYFVLRRKHFGPIKLGYKAVDLAVDQRRVINKVMQITRIFPGIGSGKIGTSGLRVGA